MKKLLFISLLFPCFCFAQDSIPQLTKPVKYRLNLRLSDVPIGTNETQRQYYFAHLNRRTGYNLNSNINWPAEPQLSGRGSRRGYNYAHVLSPRGVSFPEAIITGLLQWYLDESITKKRTEGAL